DPSDTARFAAVSKQLSSIPVRGVFSDLEIMDSSLNSIESGNELLSVPFINKAKKYINDLTKAFEYYLGRRDDRFLVFLLLDTALRLSVMLDDFRSLSTKIIDILQQNNDSIEDENSKRLSIYLFSSVTFDKFILKLDAINSIYTELAQIMNVS